MKNHTIFIKQFTALVLAALMTFGSLCDYLPVYASTSQSVKYGDSSISGSNYDPNVKGTDTYPMGYCMTITPIVNGTTFEDIKSDNNEEKRVYSNTWAVEGYIGRESAALATPSLNQSSLIFVPEAAWSATTHNTSTGKDMHLAIWNGFDSWMSDQYAVFGRSGNQTSGQVNQYKLFCNSSASDKSTVKNIIWSNMDTSKSGHKKNANGLTLHATGVFTEQLFADLTSASDANFYDFSKYMDNFTETQAKTYLKDIIAKAEQKNSKIDAYAEEQMSYLLNVTQDGSTIGYTGATAIDYLYANIYNTYISSAAKVIASENGVDVSKIKLSVSGTTYTDTSEQERWLFTEEGKGENASSNSEYAYCANVYNMGMLDLLLCGYVTAKTHGGIAADYWLTAAAKLISGSAGKDPGVRLSIQSGIIMCGSDADSKQRCVFANCTDLVNQAYGFYTADDTVKVAQSTQVKTSVGKPYSGYAGTNTSNTEVKDDVTKKVITYPSRLSDGFTTKENLSTTDLLKNTSLNPQTTSGTIPDYYASYYARLKAATSERGREINDTAAPIYGSHYWSTTALHRILKEWYKADKNGNTTTVTSKNTATFLELVRSANLGVEPYKTGVASAYGNAYLIGHSFNQENKEYVFAAKLEICSDLNKADKYKSYSKNDVKDNTSSENYFTQQKTKTFFAKDTIHGDDATIAQKEKNKGQSYLTEAYINNEKKVEKLVEADDSIKNITDTVALRLTVATNDSSKDNYGSLTEYLQKNASDAKNNIKVEVSYNVKFKNVNQKDFTQDSKSINNYTSITGTTLTKVMKPSTFCDKYAETASENHYLQTITDKTFGNAKGHQIRVKKKDSGDLKGERISYQAVVTITYTDKSGEKASISTKSNWATVDYGATNTETPAIGAKLEIKDATTGNSSSTSGTVLSDGYVSPNYEASDDNDTFTDNSGEVWGKTTANNADNTIANAATINVGTNGKTFNDDIHLRLRIASNPEYDTLKNVLAAADDKKGFTLGVTYEYARPGANSLDTKKASTVFLSKGNYLTETKLSKADLIAMADKTATGKTNVHSIKDKDLAARGIKASPDSELSYRAIVTITYYKKGNGQTDSGWQTIEAKSNWATVAFTGPNSNNNVKYKAYAKLQIRSNKADKSKSKSGIAAENNYIAPDYSAVAKKQTITVAGDTFGSKTANANTATYADGGSYTTTPGTIQDTIRLKLKLQTVSGTGYAGIAKYLSAKNLSADQIKVKITYQDKSTANAKGALNYAPLAGYGISIGSSVTVSLSDFKKYAENKSKSALAVGEDTISLSLKEEETAIRKYKAVVTITLGDTTVKAYSNVAGVSYSTDADPTVYRYPHDTIASTDTTDAYSELKEGNIYAETFEAMCGVPSTRSLYFSTGASEFIVNLQTEYDADNIATRKYNSTFAGGIDCEYKENDQAKTLASGATATATLKADKNDKTTSTQTTVGKNKITLPKTAKSSQTTINGHGESSTIKATWSGTITNNTAKPSEDTFDKGTQGPVCIGDGYKVGNGATGTVHEASPNWDVTQYNTDLSNAIAWVKELEAQSDEETEGNVYYIADSDGMKRSYHVGKATIHVEMSGSVTHAIECGTRPSYSKNGDYTSSSASSAKLKSNDASVLGSGYSYTHGTNATGSFSQNPNCNVAHSGDGEQNCTIKTDSWTLTCQIPVHAAHGGKGSECYPQTGTTKELTCGQTEGKKHTHSASCYTEKPVYASSPQCGLKIHTHDSAPAAPSTLESTTTGSGCTFQGGNHQHNHTHSFTYGTKWTDGQDSNVSYTISVTFDGGYTNAVNYDGTKSLMSIEKKTVGKSLSACALCGTCHDHTLPKVEDHWSQRLPFDTIRITNMRVWKIQDGYIEGMTEIQQGADYTGTDYEVVVSNITSGDPNVFYNVAAANSFGVSDNTSKAGRIRYSLQRGQDDNVTWEEFTTVGVSEAGSNDGLHRSNKCDGQSGRGTANGVTVGSYASKNPATTTKYGHERTWATGCLYTNSKTTTTLDIHKASGEKDVKTNYTNYVDSVDVKSYEWKRFNDRRNTPVSATVISDFLILQTTGGDHSILYHENTTSTRAKTTTSDTTHEKKPYLQLKPKTEDYVTGTSAYTAMTATTQTDFAYEESDGGLLYHNHDNCDKYKKNMGDSFVNYVNYQSGWNKLWSANPLVDKGPTITLSGYNGQYYNTTGKYNATKGTGATIATAFDNDAQYFNGASNATEYDNNCKGRVSHRGLGSGNRDASAPGLGQTRNGRNHTALMMTVSGITQNPANPNGLYMTGQSYAFWRQILEYNAKTDYEGEALTDGETAWNYSYDITSEENTTLDAYDKTQTNHYGYTLESVYTDGQEKCNNIIVQNPVSTEGARVIQSHDDSYDQRIQTENLSAVANGDVLDAQETCPGTPEACLYRQDADVTCTYGLESKRANFDIKKYTKELYDYADEGSTNEDDYGIYLTNSIANGYNKYAKVDVRPSGFIVQTDGSNCWLYNGSTGASLEIPWTDLGIDSSILTERYRIGGSFTIHSKTKTALMSAGGFHLYALGSGQLKLRLEVDNGAVYETAEILTVGAANYIAMSICAGDPGNSKIYVNGQSCTLTTVATGTSISYYGDGVRYGTGGEDYADVSTNMSFSDLEVYREAGSTSHIEACYTYVTKHYTEEEHTCNENCVTERVLTCEEPHHNGSHYDIDNPVCWKSCLEYYTEKYGYEEGTKKSNEVHAMGQKTISVKSNGQTKELTQANFILLDNFFDVYFPSVGNFYETNAYGVAYNQTTRGKGYTNSMSTAEWTREKWICLPCPVLYNNNGKWEEHEAYEWFTLSIYDENGTPNDYYHFYNLLRGGEVSLGTVQFAVEAINDLAGGHPACNAGHSMADIANNWRSGDKKLVYTTDQEQQFDCPMEAGWTTNKTRFEDYSSYHSAYTYQYIDVIGRIGNFIVEDTDDMRFSNLFKKSTWLDDDPSNDGYYIDGIVETVNAALQNTYFAWHRNDGSYQVRDVRGELVCPENQYYNTYGTQAWTNVSPAVDTADHIAALPITGAKNTISSLQDKELKLGYDILWDITTIGNYEQGSLQVKQYYYVLDTETGILYPADMYMGDGNDTNAINYFGFYDRISNDASKSYVVYQTTEDTGAVAGTTDALPLGASVISYFATNEEATAFAEDFNSLYDLPIYLNWSEEKVRRNYKTEEETMTKNVSKSVPYFVKDADGNILTYTSKSTTPDGLELEQTYSVTKNLTIPYGTYYRLGNYQLLYSGERSRTFVGSSTVTALHGAIGGSDNTELNPDISAATFGVKAQRWHEKLGAPTSAAFIAYIDRDGDGVADRIHPNEVITYTNGKTGYAKDEFTQEEDDGRYVVLMTMDITAIGSTYTLHYDQGENNGSFTVNGKTFQFGNRIPTLVGIYGLGEDSSNTIDIDTMQSH